MLEGQTFFPAAILPPVTLMTRAAIGAAIDALIAELDARAGDPDVELNGDELDGAWSHEETWELAASLSDATGAGCPIADPGGTFEDSMADLPWIEWHNRASKHAGGVPEMIGAPMACEDDEQDSDAEPWHVEPFAMPKAYGAVR